MIKIENVKTFGWEPAIRGMRNPMNSWDKSDSRFCNDGYEKCASCIFENKWKRCVDGFFVGKNDLELMLKLAKGGSPHAKYRRMIAVYMDVLAPLYWWKEFDTYKVGTVADSCSTMHKIHEKPFSLDDFSHEHLVGIGVDVDHIEANPYNMMLSTIECLNRMRKLYLETGEKSYWWQMIQLLPSSYNQRRTIMLNYEVLSSIYIQRKDHKLDEWRDFCEWIKELPCSEIITLEE